MSTIESFVSIFCHPETEGGLQPRDFPSHSPSEQGFSPADIHQAKANTKREGNQPYAKSGRVSYVLRSKRLLLVRPGCSMFTVFEYDVFDVNMK